MFDPIGLGGLPHPVHDARFYEGVPARRLGAFAIDLVATGLVGAAATLAFGAMSLGLGFALAAPIVLVASFLYRWLSIARWSATPGMLAAGIELRRLDGESLSRADAFAHTALFSLATLFVAPQIVSVVAMATGPVGRGLHDMALGSTAINRPA